MALKKAITLKNGVVVTYHNIHSIGISKIGRANCLMYQYVSKEMREQDINAYASEINIGVDADEGPSLSYERAYEKLKETDYFRGAEDD